MGGRRGDRHHAIELLYLAYNVCLVLGIQDGIRQKLAASEPFAQLLAINFAQIALKRDHLGIHTVKDAQEYPKRYGLPHYWVAVGNARPGYANDRRCPHGLWAGVCGNDGLEWQFEETASKGRAEYGKR